MSIQYQTSTATFVQLAVMTLLVILGGVTDVAKNCENAGECLTNSFLWIVIAFMLACWYAMLFAIGYFAQEKRSYKLARVLILGELFTAFVALMFLRTPSSLLGAVTSGAALLLAVWTIILAYRLHKARGSRITKASKKTSSQRPRRRLSDK
jgi:uncharacterized membrane protein